MSWARVKLKTLLSQQVQNGYSPVCPDKPNGKWVLGLGALSDFGLDATRIKPAPIDDSKVDNFLLSPGDFLVSRSNTRDKVGRSALFKGEVRNCSYPDLMMRFRANETDIYPEFLEMYLRSHEAVKYFQRSASGTSGTMVKINKRVVENLQVLLPPIPEQTAIADLLSTWDAAIEKTEKLIAAKQKRFSWLQNNLINSDSSHKGWRKTYLGEVAHITKKSAVDSVDGKTLLTVKLHCLGIEANTRIKPKLTKRGRPYYIRNVGEFIVGRQNFHNGGFGVLPSGLDGHIASNAITSLLLDSDKLSSDFLFFYFSRTDYYKRIGHIMDGTGQKELSDKQILKLPLYLPDIAIQKIISETLNTTRQEIDLLKCLADAYRKQKRGLMQKTLTGAWRIKPEIMNQPAEAAG